MNIGKKSNLQKQKMERKETSKSRNLVEKMGKRDIVKKENKENGKRKITYDKRNRKNKEIWNYEKRE